MIESLFEEFPSRQNDRSDGAGESRNPPDDQNHREAELLAVLPVVRKIVGRRTLPALTSDAADVIQAVALRLWKWREKYADKSRELSPGEWESFAARTAYNEINRHFSSKALLREVSLDAASSAESGAAVEGETKAEVSSFAKWLWQEICILSLRQRRALLLNSQELIFFVRRSGIGDEEIARMLNIPDGVWADVKRRLPLSNVEIVKLMREAAAPDGKNDRLSNKSVSKARHEARARLRKILSE